MSTHVRKAWIVAASIGGVEALKDQGYCRWNYTLRSIQQHVKNNLRSYYQAKELARPSLSMAKRGKKPEESMKKVMDLSCWGPNTVRF